MKDKQKPINNVLMITDPGAVAKQLSHRLLKDTNDRIGILVKPQSAVHASSVREKIYHLGHDQQTDLTQLMEAERFTAVYVGLVKPDTDRINKITSAMQSSHTRYLVWIVSAASADQINSLAAIIKNNGHLHFTIIRTAKLNRDHLLSYQVVKNAQPVNDSSVSAVSVADLAFQSIKAPRLHQDQDLGIAQLPYK